MQINLNHYNKNNSFSLSYKGFRAIENNREQEKSLKDFNKGLNNPQINYEIKFNIPLHSRHAEKTSCSQFNDKNFFQTKNKRQSTPTSLIQSTYQSLQEKNYTPTLIAKVGKFLHANQLSADEIATLVEIETVLKGNTCGPRSTSCADQLAQAIREVLEA